MSVPQPVSKNKPLLRALAGETVQPPPFWLMRQAGRYLPEYREVRRRAKDFLELCHTPELAVELTMQPLKRYGMDAAILFADILLVPAALGQSLAFREAEGPVLEPVRSTRDLRRLEPGGLEDGLAAVYESVRRLSARLPPEVALIGFAGAPWTVATYMVEGGSSRDFAHVKGWAYGDEDGFATLIELLVEATADYLVNQARAGAEALQLFDTWAGVLPERAFRRWCIEPTAAIVERLRAAGVESPVIGFPRGAGPLYVDYAEETGVDAVSVDVAVPPLWAARELQPGRAVQGNLDPLALVAGGETMRRDAGGILDALGHGPFIFNLGHGVVPGTPPEHVAELAAMVRGWRP